MRTMFLLSTSLLIMVHLAAQDSPITVADTGPPIDTEGQNKGRPPKTGGGATVMSTGMPIAITRQNVQPWNQYFYADKRNRFYIHDWSKGLFGLKIEDYVAE